MGARLMSEASSFIELTGPRRNEIRELREKLKLTYYLFLCGPVLVAMTALLPVFASIGRPLMQTPGLLAFLVLLVLATACWIVLACALGTSFVVLCLRFGAGWPWQDIRKLIMERSVPTNWLK
jgi:hypothetical protein